jgi:hypothetical protein
VQSLYDVTDVVSLEEIDQYALCSGVASSVVAGIRDWLRHYPLRTVENMKAVSIYAKIIGRVHTLCTVPSLQTRPKHRFGRSIRVETPP